MKKLLLFILVLFAQNFYCSQQDGLIKVDSLEQLCADKLFEFINKADISEEDIKAIIVKLQENPILFNQFIRKCLLQGKTYGPLIKDYISRHRNEFSSVMQICINLPDSVNGSFSQISSDSKYAILFSNNKPDKLVLLATGLVVDVNKDLNFKYSINNKGLVESVTAFGKSHSMEVPEYGPLFNIMETFNNKLAGKISIQGKYEICNIVNLQNGLNYYNCHYKNGYPDNIVHLNISNDKQYVVTVSKSMYIITYIGTDLLNKLHIVNLLFISFLYKQCNVNPGSIIILDDCENIIFNSLPRFMQFALLSHYQIQYMPMFISYNTWQ